MGKFAEFLKEQDNEKPYKLVVFNNTQDHVRDVGEKERTEFDLIIKSAKKLGIKILNVEHTGFFISEKNGKMFFNSLDFTVLVVLTGFDSILASAIIFPSLEQILVI